MVDFRAESKLAIEFLLRMKDTFRHAFRDSRRKLVVTDLHNVVDDIDATKTRWRVIDYVHYLYFKQL